METLYVVMSFPCDRFAGKIVCEVEKAHGIIRGPDLKTGGQKIYGRLLTRQTSLGAMVQTVVLEEECDARVSSPPGLPDPLDTPVRHGKSVAYWTFDEARADALVQFSSENFDIQRGESKSDPPKRISQSPNGVQ